MPGGWRSVVGGSYVVGGRWYGVGWELVRETNWNHGDQKSVGDSWVLVEVFDVEIR